MKQKTIKGGQDLIDAISKTLASTPISHDEEPGHGLPDDWDAINAGREANRRQRELEAKSEHKEE